MVAVLSVTILVAMAILRLLHLVPLRCRAISRSRPIRFLVRLLYDGPHWRRRRVFVVVESHVVEAGCHSRQTFLQDDFREVVDPARFRPNCCTSILRVSDLIVVRHAELLVINKAQKPWRSWEGKMAIKWKYLSYSWQSGLYTKYRVATHSTIWNFVTFHKFSMTSSYQHNIKFVCFFPLCDLLSY